MTTGTRVASTSGAANSSSLDPAALISRCEDIIKSFNPITHSIDTHCKEQLGELGTAQGKPDAVFVHQVVYGVLREKAVLDVSDRAFETVRSLFTYDFIPYYCHNIIH